MISLLPYQIKQAEGIERALRSHYRAALDASDPGTGKTYVACHVAKQMGCPVVIVTTKATLPSWQNVAEGFGLAPILVTNYENIRRGKLEQCRKAGDKNFRWNLPHGSLIIFDECQKCKGSKSLNAQLLIAARMQGYRVLLCSATAASNPMEMKALGFALGLHNLNNYWAWARQHGVEEGTYGWIFNGNKNHLLSIHRDIFPLRGSRMRIADIPDFPETIVEAAVIETGKAKAIQREYDSLKKELHRAEREEDWETLDVIADELEAKKANSMTILLRARQAVEFHKVDAMVEMTNSAIEEGLSVVLLVNFSETICELSKKLKCSDIICGGQDAADRQAIIEQFQSNKIKVVIANIQAGGVGVSLHDPSGERQRLSIISPTFSAGDLKQALGRVHRAGGASSIQKVLYAAGTCEEHTAKKCAAKLAHIDLLNDGDMQPFPFHSKSSSHEDQ